MKPRNVFLVIWIALLIFPVYTVISRTPNLELTFSKPNLMFNFLQRSSGLIIFTLLPIQIILGSFMRRLTERFGSWVFWVHITQAMLVYSLILFHPVFHLLLLWKSTGTLDPFYIFTDFCLICETKQELYLTAGRIAFFLFTFAYFAGKFRTIETLRKHWKKLHILNFFAFFLVAFHAKKLGSDIHSVYYYWYYWTAVGVVTAVSLYKLFRFFQKLKFT